MDPSPPRVSRRIFLQVSGSAALVPVAADAANAAVQRPAATPAAASGAAADNAPYMFFNREEAAFMEAAVQRLIPPDAVGPSAQEAGVPHYLDRQLGGAWGAGERLYRAGPWQAGLPTQGYQLPYTPAELFRTALRGLRADLQQRGQGSFETLSGDAQDAYLTLLQTSETDLAGVPARVFFESLLGMTIEGYFGDPVYGGNRGMAAWQMIGFPGAHAAYYDDVDRHGLAYTGAPRSLSEVAGHVHEMPDIPATAPAPAPTPARAPQPGHGPARSTGRHG